MTETTEIETVPITAEEARILTDAIKSALVATWNLREQAYKSRVWVPLGYSSWEDYCNEEFSTIAIPRTERQSVISAMRSAGMSTRAIAAATGLGLGTVHRELSGVPNGTPETVVGVDGKTYGGSPPQPRTDLSLDQLTEMAKPLIELAGTDSPVGNVYPRVFEELAKAAMRALGRSYPDAALDALIEEKRGEPLDVARCRALATAPEEEFEDILAEMVASVPGLTAEEKVLLRLKESSVRAERRIGQLLMEDEEAK